MDVAIDKTTLGEVSRKQRGEGKEGEAVREGEKEGHECYGAKYGAKINVHAAANHWQMRARAPCPYMSTISQDAFMHWKINIHT